MAVRLTKLRVLGFKSFADPVELSLDRGITAIIGPNGSGKSNLAEAIAWVLGEQSAASVRGRRAEDVIFAGGPGRASLGMAEVTLTLEQDGEELGFPFQEVSVTRRVFRDGESQYLVNGNRVRLRDLLQIAAALRSEWMIVRQSAVDAVLDMKTAERRDFLEHAVGLSGLRLRQAETKQQLAQAEAHAQRLEDLLRELEPHLEVLAEAAARAREALEVRKQLRSALLHLAGVRWREAIEGARQAHSRLATLEEEQTRLRQRLEDLTQRALVALAEQERLVAEREELTRLRYEYETQRTRALHCAELARTRVSAITAQLGALQWERERSHQDRTTLAGDLLRVGKLLSATAEELAEAEQILRKREEQAAEQSRRASLIRETLRKLEEYLRGATATQQKLARERAALAAAREARQKEFAYLGQRCAELERECARYLQELNELTEHEEMLRERVRAATFQLEQLQSESSRVRDRLERQKQVVRELEREHLLIQTRLEALAQAIQGERVSQGVRSILHAARRGELKGIIGTLGTLIEVPADLEAAIEAALGSHVQDLVVESWSDAEAAITHLKKTRAGRATFHPLDTVREGTPSVPPLLVQQPGVLGRAVDLIHAPPSIQKVLTNLLSRVLVVSDLATARRLLPILPPGWIVVTPEGELARSSGSVTGGVLRGRERGLLAHSRERRDLVQRAERVTALLQQAQAELEILRLQEQSLQEHVNQARLMLDNVREGYTECSRRREHVQHTVRSLTQTLERERERLNELETQLAVAIEQDREFEQAEQVIVRQLEGLGTERARLLADLASLEAPDVEREQLLRKIAILRERQQALQREEAQLRQRLSRLDEQEGKLAEQQAELEQQQSAYQTEAQQAEQLAGEIAEQLEQLEGEARRVTRLLQAQEESLAELRVDEAACRERLERVEREISQTEAAYHSAEQRKRDILEQLRWELETTEQVESLLERVEKAAAVATEPRRELEHRISTLRQRWQQLSRYGEAAIAHYEAERARYETLRAELDDVRQTIQTLHKLLAELERQIRRDFRQSLRTLDEAFSQTFRELFGGGRARLITHDGTGSIEGVDLEVQPAGKRVRSLQQLSGGERALAALALRFALFHLTPLPFCVLDEVDAALDEANVLRFRALLERFASTTQFLVITHNRATIEAAQVLYGVTMGEDGVSQVVSLRLADYAKS